MHGVAVEKGDITVAYRIGSQVTDICKISADTTKLKWICRDRKNYLYFRILKPFTLALDIITFPLQIVLLMLLAVFYKGP